MIGSLCGCWFKRDPEKETRLTKDERLKTKKLVTALGKLDDAAKEAFPIALMGFAGWTLIWLYRGLKYPSVRGKVPLNRYVDNTFHIAKTFGVATFLAGLFYTVREKEAEIDKCEKDGVKKVQQTKTVKKVETKKEKPDGVTVKVEVKEK